MLDSSDMNYELKQNYEKLQTKGKSQEPIEHVASTASTGVTGENNETNTKTVEQVIRQTKLFHLSAVRAMMRFSVPIICPIPMF